MSLQFFHIYTPYYARIKGLVYPCLLLFFLASSTVVSAQINKGAKMIGGSASGKYSVLHRAMGTKETTLSFSFQPSFGYLVSDKFLIGGGVNLSYLRINWNAHEDFNDLSFLKGYGLFPFTRYYVVGNLFSEIQFNLHSEVSTHKIAGGANSDSIKSFRISWVPSLGYNFFISKSISIESKLSYKTNVSGTGDMGLFFSAGVQVFITKSRSRRR